MRGLLVWGADVLVLAGAGCITVREHAGVGPTSTPVPTVIESSPITTPVTPVIPGSTPAPPDHTWPGCKARPAPEASIVRFMELQQELQRLPPDTGRLGLLVLLG